MIAILFGILLLIFSLLVFLDIWLRLKPEYKIAKMLPGPYIYPLIGNAPAVIFKNQKQIFRLMRDFAIKYNRSHRFWSFGKLYLNVVRAADIQILLSSSKHITKTDLYRFLHPVLGTGLLTSSGKKWFTRRRILTPAFHFSILQDFLSIFREESQRFVKMLKEREHTNETDLKQIIPRFTLNTICETAMGVKLDSSQEPDKYRWHLIQMGRILVDRCVNVWLHVDFLYNIFGVARSLNKHINVVHDFSWSVIDCRRKKFQESFKESSSKNKNGIEHQSQTQDNENIYFDGHKRRSAMLDTLLAAEMNDQQIDENGIREEVDTFMFEGFDTTSSALLFTLFMLAHHRKWQNLVYQEIVEILGNRKENELTIQDYSDMKVLNRVIKETLRLYPPVPFIGRELQEPLTIGELNLPVGTQVHIYIIDLHRDPVEFPEPEKFDPDRFLPHNAEKMHPFAYIPFSAGPRNCIGQKFALLEIQTLITYVLLNFELIPITKVEDVILITDLTLRSQEPIKIKFNQRQ